MIGASVPYDLVLLIHVLAAVATIVVFATMRYAALALTRAAPSAVQAKRFPQRRNWAARAIHLLPLSGLYMSLTGDSAVSLAKPWIGTGILCYLLAAGHLEARTLPQERMIAEIIHKDGSASVERGRQFMTSVNVLLALVGVALIAMLVQF
ncbi:MAG TPA: hypothetical protein VNE22_03065 [Acidimicrobiales bacterium]|nr:hypothetical protein [Acidimicrobiales bacterium]